MVDDPNATLLKFSNRQESAFQYGDVSNRQIDNVSQTITQHTDKEEPTTNADDDPYDFEEADKKYLGSKPTCFLLLGKPGVGKTTLARKLADDWHAELINIADLIAANIKQKTEIGIHARDLLLRGETVSDQMVARMLDMKMRSAEVAHHGYVLDGFPVMDENVMKLRDQMEAMKNWPLPPDYVINIRIPDADLINRRQGQKIDPMTGASYIKEQYAPAPIKKVVAKQQTDDSEEESEDDDGDDTEEETQEEDQAMDEFFAPVPTEIVERLVTRPEDMMPDVADSIQQFKDQLLRMLEEYMSSLPQSYLVELDGNMSPTILFAQLLERLNAYALRRAARVERFFPPEEEEEEISHEGHEMDDEEEAGEKAVRSAGDEEAPPADEMETEELMTSLAGSNVLSNRFKWQRSRWLRLDPVALKQGNRVPGRQDLAVRFMDKIFVLSSKESLKEFQKNPRRYITSPRPPCKILLYGPRSSGVEQLAQDISKKYNAIIIDMNTYAQTKMDELRKQYIDNVRSEVERTTIDKLQLQLEVEAADKLVRDAEEKETEVKPQLKEEDEKQSPDETSSPPTKEDNETATEQNDLEKSEEQPPSEKTPGADEESPQQPPEEEQSHISTPMATADETVPREDLRGLGPEDEQTQYEPPGKVTADHPEVKKVVEKAVEEARKAAVNIPADIYADLMQKAIQTIEQEQREKNPNGPLFGNWIFVNFPYENDIWTHLIEKNIQPDDVLIVQDSSTQLEALQKRWYSANRTDIDRQIREREEREAMERRIKDEEQKRRMEEMKVIAERERNQRQAERQQKVDAGQPVEEEEEDESGERDMELAILEDKKYEPKKEDFIDKIPETIPEEDESVSKEIDKDKASSADNNRPTTSASPITIDQDLLPPAGVERDEFIKAARVDMDRINEVAKLISNILNIEPITIELMKDDGDKLKTNDELFQNAIDALEKQFKYTVLESENIDEDIDEEEDTASEGGDEEDEDEEEHDLLKRDRKKQLGDTSIYDPVALYEKNILLPGKADLFVSYNAKMYRFASEDNRNLFTQAPLKYTPINKPPTLPAIRMLFIGPEGVGKSLHGRELAKRLDTFHIKFRDRLQELIVGKTKTKLGPEHSESHEDPDAEEDEEKPEKPVDEVEELTAEEENIKAYLQDGEALSTEILDKLLKPWWTEEPFRSRGIILEGFPNTEDEAVWMIENGLVPDIVVQLDAEVGPLIKRVLPRRMEQWQKKIQLRREKRARNKAKRDRNKKKAMEERRAELLHERQQRIEAGEAVDQDEIEQALANEFPLDEEEGDNPQEEDPEMAKGRIGEMIEQQANDVKEKIEVVKKIFHEENIPYATINASDKAHYVKNRIAKKIERFVNLRPNLLERIYIIKPQLAQQLIDIGYLHYSKFGKFCPVSLHNGDCFPPPFGLEKVPRTVVYRKYVYYLADDEARNEFMKNPMFYLRQSPPKPLIPAKIALVGPPKSGKTTAAKRLLQEIGCARLSLGDAIRYVLDKQRQTVLGQEMQAILLTGNEIIPDVAVRCLEIALMDAKCQTRGYILDGFPLTKKHVELLSEKGIIPFKLFELECDLTECTARAIKDRADPARLFPLPDSPEAIAYRYAIYQHELAPVREWYSKEHKNWMMINAKNNKWNVWDKVLQETCVVTRKIQDYLERQAQNKAASIADLCVLPQELFNRLGEFEHYCPVSLILRDELVDCSADTKTDFVAEYRGRYYRMAGPDELKQFLDNPELFAPLEPNKLPPPPNRRPHRKQEAEVKAMFPKSVEFAGYCPVTYRDGGKKYECLVTGQQEFAVEYRDKLYFLLNEEARERFMRQPEKYWNLRLPSKLPPPKNPLDLLNLPCLGYLEQTVTTAIIKSLTTTGCFKPKFPFLSVQRSALIYMAYHLKAYNNKSSDYLRRKFRRKLYIFEEHCELINYLADKSTVRYKEPELRTPEFNVKYETFFALQHNVPTSNWLT